MVQTLKRPLLVITAVAAIAGIASSTALAARGHGFSMRMAAARGGFDPFAGGPLAGAHFGAFGGFGLAGPGGGRGPGGGILAADVLTPAASFLGVSVSTLAADLKSGKTLAQEATAKGKTASALIDAIVASEKTVLDSENAAGWITDAQETALIGTLTDEITNLVNAGPPVPPTKKPGLLDTAATYLGISVSELQADLKAGKTLADEATAKGKTVDGLVSALTAQAKTSLDAAVTAGTITAAQEQTLLTNLTQRVTDLVNNAKLGSRSMTRIRALFMH
jgi:D-Tyr-tRNAtyr deacylase